MCDDVGAVNLLPALLRGISSVRYIGLSIWKKRVAWHVVPRCSELLVQVQPRLAPPRLDLFCLASHRLDDAQRDVADMRALRQLARAALPPSGRSSLAQWQRAAARTTHTPCRIVLPHP